MNPTLPNHRHVTLVTASILLTACSLGAQEPATVELAKAPQVIVENGGLWPVLVEASPGKLRTVVFNQPAHSTLPGDVACHGSDDGGATWRQLGIAGARPTPEGTTWGAALGVAGNGDLVALVNGKTDPTDQTTIIATRVMRSSDGGVTWAQTATLAAAPEKAFAHFPFGRVLRARDGSLRAFTYSGAHDDPAHCTVTMLTSHDDGRTFPDVAEVCPGTEVAACEVTAGEWILAVRTATEVRLRQYRSVDNGDTWKEEGDLTEVAEIPGDFLKLADGRLLLVYGDRREERGLGMKLSVDAGRTWSESQVLLPLGMGDCGYPSAVQLADGHVLIAYYSNKASYHQGYHTGLVEWMPAAATLLDVRKIWDKAPHNGFTDLIRFRDQWFCVFRESSGHMARDGKVRILRSADGEAWASAALLEIAGQDLREAKFSITPDQRLMLSGAAALPPEGKGGHQSLNWFSSDGFDWSAPQPIGDLNAWIWRTTWHDGASYGVAYCFHGEKKALLYRSTDGLRYDVHVGDLWKGNANEASILFHDSTAYCLMRRDPAADTATGSALLGTAAPPYREWTWKDLGVRLGGPHLLRLPDGRFIAAGRHYTGPWNPSQGQVGGPFRTTLWWLDPTAGRLTEMLTLPSGGDTSYPGLVWHENQLWVSYYSGHEDNDTHAHPAIYLARIGFRTNDKE